MSESASPCLPSVVIWKFALEIAATQTVKLPKKAQIISVDADPALPQEPNGKLGLWAVVRKPNAGWEKDPEQFFEQSILIFGTGHELPTEGDMSHLNTVILNGMVWHVFQDHSNDPEPGAEIMAAVLGGVKDAGMEPIVSAEAFPGRASLCKCGHQRQAHTPTNGCEYTDEANGCSCSGFDPA